MNEFFEDLGGRWTRAALERDVKIEPPELDAAVAFELLELARVAAQTRERRFAPLACYQAGIAVERLRASRGSVSGAEAAAYVNEVRASLESVSPPE
jgi:hypothetical protein